MGYTVSEITDLRIYPIKSCRGIPVPSSTLTRQGLLFDRRWMFVDKDHKFITIRSKPQLTLINTAIDTTTQELTVTIGSDTINKSISVPLFPDPTWLEAHSKVITVDVWEYLTDAYAYTDPKITEIFSDLLEEPVTLVMKGPEPRICRGNGDPKLLGRVESVNFPDVLPLQIASESSLGELNDRLVAKGESKITIERFRPNIIIKGDKPWSEDSWKTVRINGTPSLSAQYLPSVLATALGAGNNEDAIDVDVVARCARCQVPNVNPDTAEKHKHQPWDVLVSYRRVDEGIKFKPCFGMLCCPRNEGEVKVGMRFEVLEETKEHRYTKGFCVPLTLVLVEHFDPDDGGAFQMQNVTIGLATVTNSIGLTNSTTRKAVPQIPKDAQPFATREMDLKLPPFKIVQTDVKAVIKAPKERLRLTFQTEMGGKHRMYCPVPTMETSSLECLAPNPLVRFTGIYLPDDSYVTLYASNEPEKWMGKLPDDLPLGALSIPGTHNAPTCHNAPPSVRCQAVSPKEQLRNGVRFFDLRVQVPDPYDPSSDKLALVHAVFPISLTGTKYFRDLYNDIIDFLKENPSEILIMSLKREGTGNGTDQQLSRILKDHYTNPQQWFTQPRVPTLGEVRGRIVLVRRFMLDEPLKHEWDGKGWGIDAHEWADNTPSAMCPSGDVCVQDFYEVLEKPTIEQKITYAKAQLERSGCCCVEPGKRLPLYVNFLSASNFWKVGTWPEKIAAEVNPAVVQHLCKQHMVNTDGGEKEGDWSTGIVVADWVGLDGDWDLVRCVVGMNSKLIR